MKRLTTFFVFFLFVPSAVLLADVKIAQSGPGVIGTFSPLHSETAISLNTERVTVFLHDTEAEVEAEYLLVNQTSSSQTVLAGLPSLAISSTSLGLTDLSATIDGATVSLVSIDEPYKPDFDTRSYIPLIQTFDLQVRWFATHVTVPPQGQATVSLRFMVPYLGKEEELEGRNQLSPLLFRYERGWGGRWEGPVEQSAVNLRYRMKHSESVTLAPRPLDTQEETRYYAFRRREPNALDAITMVYDPIRFSVTPFGLEWAVPPVPLEREGISFDYENLFDSDPETAWCEGERGDAVGRGFEIEWGKLRSVRSVRIFPGISEDRDRFRESNRIKALNVYLGRPGSRSKPIRIDFKDAPEVRDYPILSGDEATMLIVEILAVYPGPDRATCIGDLVPQLK